jgi:hypothetical protein
MLGRGLRSAILWRINGTMLLRSNQRTVHVVGRRLSLIAKTLPEFRMEEGVYFATRVEKLLPPQEGHQEAGFIRGLRSISVRMCWNIELSI